MNTNKEFDTVMELYRMTVRSLLSGNKPGLVPNASHRHASIIIEELVRSSQLKFHAYCGKMSRDVWTDDVMEQIRLADSRHVDIRIVTSEPVEQIPPFLSGKVSVLDINSMGDLSDAFRNISHFSVADGKSLRLERDHGARTAIFAANRIDIASELEKIFCTLSGNAKVA